MENLNIKLYKQINRKNGYRLVHYQRFALKKTTFLSKIRIRGRKDGDRRSYLSLTMPVAKELKYVKSD